MVARADPFLPFFGGSIPTLGWKKMVQIRARRTVYLNRACFEGQSPCQGGKKWSKFGPPGRSIGCLSVCLSVRLSVRLSVPAFGSIFCLPNMGISSIWGAYLWIRENGPVLVANPHARVEKIGPNSSPEDGPPKFF